MTYYQYTRFRSFYDRLFYACMLAGQLKAKVAELLEKAKAADNADLPDKMDIPKERERREKRLAAIAAAKAEIEKRAVERHACEQANYEKK